MADWLEDFWGDLLSEEPLRIIAAWELLDAEAQVAIHAHLQRMMIEDGWADVQRDAARAALHAIDSDDEDIV
ncbi:MAG: hypothetical protein ACYDBJ_06775 [Aggregatilineales bacterium]